MLSGKIEAAKALIKGYETLESPLAQVLISYVSYEMRYTGFSEKAVIKHIGTNVYNPLVDDRIIQYAADLTEAYNVVEPVVTSILV